MIWLGAIAIVLATFPLFISGVALRLSYLAIKATGDDE